MVGTCPEAGVQQQFQHHKYIVVQGFQRYSCTHTESMIRHVEEQQHVSAVMTNSITSKQELKSHRIAEHRLQPIQAANILKHDNGVEG